MRDRILLHICCAPDATIPWPSLRSEGFEADGFFYGGNIHPASEWEARRDAVLALSRAFGWTAEIAPYQPERWHEAADRAASAPEGGARCAICFSLQLGAAALYAASNGYKYLCSTLSISPHKSPDAIGAAGEAAAESAGVKWVHRVWRKNDGFRLSVARSREMGLYRQNYCGCVYSMRRPGACGSAA
ncbi:MAG: epoxyqueuosine reductase QueH [Synergistaceae bacterium]|jgi:predicted adenine nucleotide alpha hydrolase (AANH) superfamily ATPase|nr:epoxyqueuosine reductase QueH [Synergistaceae bacterium]